MKLSQVAYEGGHHGGVAERPDLAGLYLPDFDDVLSVTDLFLDGGNVQDLADLFAHLRS